LRKIQINHFFRLELKSALFRRKFNSSCSLENILSEEIKYIYKNNSFISLPLDAIASIVKNEGDKIELIPLIFNILTKKEAFKNFLNSFNVSKTTFEEYFDISIYFNETNFFYRVL
jgi:hypothetical protein